MHKYKSIQYSHLKTLVKNTVDIRFVFSHLLCKIDSMQEPDGSKQSFDETGIA